MLGKTGNKGSVGRNRFRKKADQLRKLRGAIPIETLEPRRLLSVSAATILGPFTTASGGVWTYTVTASGNGVSASGTATRTNVGPATAPSGNSAIEQDLSTTETASNGATLTTSNQDYYAMTGAGLVQYAEVGIGKDTTETDIFTPPKVALPASLTENVPVAESDTDNITIETTSDGDTTTSSNDESTTITLASESLSSLTVPAGTFNVYAITIDKTVTQSDGTQSSDTTTTYFSPQVGIVEQTDASSDGITSTLELTTYNIPGDTLQFVAQPVDTPQGQTLPNVSVEFLNSSDQLDTSINGNVTLTLQGGNGTLSGTTTEAAVNGVATFTDLSVDDQGGTYTLLASSPSANSTVTSNPFTIDANTLTWTGGGDGTSWSDPQNWDQDQAPVNGDSLVFQSGAPLSPNNDIAGLTINTIDIRGGGYTLTGNAISLTGGLTSEAGNNTYDIDTTLVDSPTISDQTGDLTINSTLSGGGGLTVAGNGTVDFAQDDNYSGGTTLAAGVTIDDDDLADEFGDGTITIGAGAAGVTLANTSDSNDTIDNDIIMQDGATLATDPEFILGGTVQINSAAAFAPTASSDVLLVDAGAISGTGTITIKGGGKVQLTGDLASTIQLNVASGELDLGANLQAALGGTPQVVVTGGTLQLMNSLKGSGGIDLQGGTLTSNGAGGYDGVSDLDNNGTTAPIVQLTPNANDLGTGPVIVTNPTGGGGITTAPVLDASGSPGQIITLNNPFTLQNSADLTIKGQIAFGAPVNLATTTPSEATIQTSTNGTSSDTDQIEFSGGFSGTGVSLGEGLVRQSAVFVNGVCTIEGEISTNTEVQCFDHVVLGANVQGSFEVDNGATGELLSSFGGSGSIVINSATLISDGASGFSGSVVMANSYANSPTTVELLDGYEDLGTGTITVSASSTNSKMILDASQASDNVVLPNALMLFFYSPLQIKGTITFDGAVIIPTNVTPPLGSLQEGEIDTFSSDDQVILRGGIQGSGTIFVSGGLGTTMLYGDIDGVEVWCQDEVVIEPTLLGPNSNIFVYRGTLLSSGDTSYNGKITLAKGGGTLVVSPTASQFGTAQIVVDTSTGPGSSLATIDASVSTQGVLTNLSFAGSSAVMTTGNVTLQGVLTLNGNDYIYTVGASDQLQLLAGMQQTAPTDALNITGPGTVTVTGDIPAALTLGFDGGAEPSSALGGELDLGANLLAPLTTTNQVGVTGGSIKLLPNLSGNGGISLGQGAVLSSTGASGYSGTITLGGNSKILATTQSALLGTGPLFIQNSVSGTEPVIDASGNTQTVTLNNPLIFRQPAVINFADLVVGGNVTFTGPITVNGTAEIDTLNSTDQLSLSGGVQGTGTLALDGPGVTTLTGSVAAGVVLTQPGLLSGDSGQLILGANLLGTGNQLVIQGGAMAQLLTLSGAGGIDVQNGTLSTNTTTGTGVSLNYTGTVTLESGDIQDYDASDIYALGTGPLNLQGGFIEDFATGVAALSNPVNVTGSVTMTSKGRFKLLQTLNLAAGSSLDVFQTLAITGSITGAGTIILDSTLFAVSSSNPNYNGNINYHSGLVEVTNFDALGTGPAFVMLASTHTGILQQVSSIGDPVLDNPLTIQAGTFDLIGQLTFPNGITVDSGATLEISGAGSQVVVSGPLAGAGSIVVGAGNFADPGGSSGFTGSVQIQNGGQVTPTLTVTDAGGVANGSPFPATALLSAPGISPAGSLQGVSPTFAYYTGNTTTGTASATAPSTPGTYTVVASFAGSASYSAVQSSPVTFTILAADKLVFSVQPRDSTAGEIDPVVVQIENSQGQLVASDNSTVTLSVASGPGILGGTVTVNAKHGVATFDHLFLTTAGTYTLKATDGDDTAAMSQSFKVTPDRPAKLVFVQQPSGASAGSSIGTIVVDVEDQYGNLETGFDSYVTLWLESESRCGSILDLAAVRAVNGIATFKGISIDAAGTYRLLANADIFLIGASNSFTITANPRQV